ncbi:unnamed protein product, partial [Amoebophrya sp. A120]
VRYFNLCRVEKVERVGNGHHGKDQKGTGKMGNGAGFYGKDNTFCGPCPTVEQSSQQQQTHKTQVLITHEEARLEATDREIAEVQ